MSDSQLRLHRYEGRYLIGEEWVDDNFIQTFLNVKVEGDRLSVREHICDHTHGERPMGEPSPMIAGSEHSFDVGGDTGTAHPHRLRFEIGDDGVAHSLIVIQDGEPSEPGPRFVPLPQETPGRRGDFEWLDLGHPQLCMTAEDTVALTSFYKRLGFVQDPRVINSPDPETSGVVSQGRTVLAFLDFQPQSCINFRGSSILTTAFEFARRGYPLYHGYAMTTHIRGDETGGFFIYDPDGHRMFFDTHAPERPAYEAWKNGTLEPEAGNHHERNPLYVPESLSLGQVVVCLGVTDLSISTNFYRGMGFETIDQTPESTTLFSRPARENRYTFPLRLRQDTEPRYSFGFLCADVEAVCASIKERDIDIITTSDGPAFVDPDGNCVTLLSAHFTIEQYKKS